MREDKGGREEKSTGGEGQIGCVKEREVLCRGERRANKLDQFILFPFDLAFLLYAIFILM